MNSVEIHFDRPRRSRVAGDRSSTEMLLDEGESADPDMLRHAAGGRWPVSRADCACDDRARFTLIDAQVTDGRLIAQPPRKNFRRRR